ncbi:MULTISPECIES: glycosyltransferase family 2 protein [unclassified Colwellia]|jgi:cellulose synthase/poly-beta-1,6-N-acetylglucosamine synthase-like glycosyltransferase|uniref:glycosyltransferase family 2 protein n=1 Tax=unclassified Colwellia TaxID=196834 RepID=UPI0015F567A7|nr:MULTISPECIES: glycosyltransferase family 2 protein [unclassified Colwellia]MBA6252573.1 glycosyltransferase family 2 protein [Colwellia sp. MB3u-55]MBA6397201.1 glycosyltransferase family 2 protein [Colwellia sp. BRX10-4]
MITLFWLALFLIIYSYLLYPLLLKVFVTPKEIKMEMPTDLPSVDVIIAAYNEESCIKERIENALAQDYPGKVQVLVASDGSEDNTGKIIESFSDPRVIAFNYEVNRGKISVLNDLIAKSKAKILVFTDANTDFNTDAISVLVSSFNNNIGAVSGELILETDDGNQNLDGFYWKYEQFLKKAESQLGSLLGANGAIYALYRDLYIPLSTDTIVDDFCIVMNVKKQGYDVVYNNKAIAKEEVAPSMQDEFGRRVRIGIGNYKAFFANLWALSPMLGIMSWCYWSHKVLRWFAPHLMLILFIANASLLGNDFFNLILALQIAFYGTGLIGLKRINQQKHVNKPVAIISFFVSMNIALAQGFLRFCKGHKSGGWKRTARQGENS